MLNFLIRGVMDTIDISKGHKVHFITGSVIER